MATGLLVIEAAKMAKEKKPLEEIIARLDEIRGKTKTYFTVDTLEYLARNGRIGQAKKLLGNLIGMKPILCCEGGEVRPYSKAIGKRKMMEKLLATLEEYSKHDSFEGVFGVVWSDNHGRYEELVAAIEERLPVKSLVSGQASPVIGAHAGPGTLGVICY